MVRNVVWLIINVEPEDIVLVDDNAQTDGMQAAMGML